MSKELTKLEYWETKEYKERISTEWFALGMIDPLAYKNKSEWVAALDYERQIKSYIYEIRSAHAEQNKYECSRTGIKKYMPGYKPLDWDELQAEAFQKYGKQTINYIYNPLASDNIDDYYFDFRVADVWCDWIEAHMCHVEGDLGNQLVLLSLEQRNFFRNIFGWKRKDNGLRRYNEILKYIPRKNSKTFDLACTALGTLALDREHGCKVVAVATSEDQAKKALSPARAIIDKDKNLQVAGGMLSNYFTAWAKSITAQSDTDSFLVLPFKEEVAHGGNFHLSILDEIHVMPDDSMYKVAVSSQGARSQPIICMITTAGTSEESFCNRKFSFAKSVCRGLIKDDEFLPILYYSDEKEFNDDWNDEALWVRVNPMYGLGKKVSYMKRMYKNATNDPLFENTFKQLDINMVTEGEFAAFNMVKYNNCKQDMSKIKHDLLYKQEIPLFLKDETCFAGLDFASKKDMCALTLDFYETGWVISWPFLPDKAMRKIKDVDRFKSRLNICGEEVIDWAELTADIIDILQSFNVKQLSFDPRFAGEIMQNIRKAFDNDEEFALEQSQTAAALNEATRNAISQVEGEVMKTNGCPVLAWCINNAVVKENSQACIIIQKPNSGSAKKIDCAAAWINARALVIQNETEDTLNDIYDSGGSYF